MKAMHAAEEYARRARHVETLKSFDTNVQGGTVILEWENGRCLVGYHELRREMASVVSEGFEAIKAEAIRRAEARLAEAEKELRDAMETSGDRT